MRIGIVGAGRIGGGLARLLAPAGHELVLSFARDTHRLQRLADDVGGRVADPAAAAEHGEVVVLSVAWGLVDTALQHIGGPNRLTGKLVIDTTNQFGPATAGTRVLDLGGESAARFNAHKAPGARWAKAFNTLTAGFQASSAGRTGADRVVMFYATDADSAVAALETLILDAGFTPVRTGTLARDNVGHQEPKGDLYGEEFHYDQAIALVNRLRGTPPSGRGRP